MKCNSLKLRKFITTFLSAIVKLVYCSFSIQHFFVKDVFKSSSLFLTRISTSKKCRSGLHISVVPHSLIIFRCFGIKQMGEVLFQSGQGTWSQHLRQCLSSSAMIFFLFCDVGVVRIENTKVLKHDLIFFNIHC